jgi:ABC-type glutathione transport system ATPase component
MSSLLTLRNLTVTIAGNEIVHGIDLDLARGETLALVGESGSGKSMTAMALMGISPPGSRVVATQMLFENGKSPAALRGDRLSMVFQEPMTALNPVFTIADQLMTVYRQHRGGRPAEARDRALHLLDRVGLPNPVVQMGKFPHQLSGGQRQRVLIAMALMCEPDLLIADEPTTALDVTTQIKLLDLLGDLQAELGLGMLFISHDLGVVDRVSHRVAVMQQGHIVETGTTEQVLRAPVHPYTRKLINSLPRPRVPEHRAAGATLLKARGVGRSYTSSSWGKTETFRALDNVSLDLEEGEILGIVGESGCGKSTLARILIGLDRTEEGSVEIGGKAATSLPQRSLAKLVQPVFQDPFGSLNPRWTIGRILDLPLKLHTTLNELERKARVNELLHSVDLPLDSAKVTPRALSGGQRQRVAIARALAVEPRVIVCDEPTSALDVSVQAQILSLLRTLRQDRGLSLIFISHDLAVIENLCDRVMVMHKGKVVEEGNADRIFANPQHPHTQALKDAILRVEPLQQDGLVIAEE